MNKNKNLDDFLINTFDLSELFPLVDKIGKDNGKESELNELTLILKQSLTQLMFDGQQSITSGIDIIKNLIKDLKRIYWKDGELDSFSSALYKINKIIYSKDLILEANKCKYRYIGNTLKLNLTYILLILQF